MPTIFASMFTRISIYRKFKIWCLRHSLLIRQPLSDRAARRTWATGLRQIL